MLAGICSASRKGMEFLLGKEGGGQVAILIPGGTSEPLDCHPNTNIVHLKKRKGFVKLALKNGSPLVPVFVFGETDIFDQVKNPEGSFLRTCQNKLLKIIGLPPFILTRVFPNPVPVTTVVGAPISVEKIDEPTREDIDSLHAKYVDALSELYYSNRDKYAPNPNVDLKIV